RMFESLRVRNGFSEGSEDSPKILLRRSSERLVVKHGEIIVASELGKPVVHRLDNRHDPITAVSHQITDLLFFDLLRRLAGSMDQLHVKRYEGVAWIAHQQDDPRAGQFSCR